MLYEGQRVCESRPRRSGNGLQGILSPCSSSQCLALFLQSQGLSCVIRPSSFFSVKGHVGFGIGLQDLGNLSG